MGTRLRQFLLRTGLGLLLGLLLGVAFYFLHHYLTPIHPFDRCYAVTVYVTAGLCMGGFVGMVWGLLPKPPTSTATTSSSHEVEV